jgi:NACHT domain
MLAQTRQRVLARLRRTYKELLAQSLQGHAWIDLGLTEKPDVLRNATTLLLRSIDHQSERPLPAGTGILEAFDLAEHELLILGEPGAGKSTFLLSLAEQLLARAEADPSYPLPLLLPLASWAEKRSPLQPWITEQLRQIYGLPVSLGEHWQERDQLLPLLDGLDEMEPSARISCIEAINAYHLERPAVPLVVCSRLADYEYASAKRRLVLGRAIVVQPLSVAQADAALAEGGQPFSTLRTAFQNHPTLQELASTPLMLSILMLTYRQVPIGDLPAEESQLHQQIWQDYVRHMVQSRGDTARYPLATTQRWLGWLAREMRQRNQSLFSMRHLRADWLPPRERRFYWWSYPFLGGALLGLLYGSILFGPTQNLQGGLLLGAATWILFVWYQKLYETDPIMSLSDESTTTRSWSATTFRQSFPGADASKLRAWRMRRHQFQEQSERGTGWSIRQAADNGLLLMLLFGGVGGVLTWLTYGKITTGVSLGLLFGVSFGLLGGLNTAAQQATLRFWLWQAGNFSWDGEAFLEDATTRILLRRAEGEYRFTHRLLMDYFAELES